MDISKKCFGNTKNMVQNIQAFLFVMSVNDLNYETSSPEHTSIINEDMQVAIELEWLDTVVPELSSILWPEGTWTLTDESQMLRNFHVFTY